MNEAQKFLLSNECDDLRLKDAQKVEDWIYVSDIMERYHQDQVKKLTIPVVSNRRKLLIATIEKVRYNLDGYGALTSSQIAERLEKAINCC